jgi:hypothetical protein
LNWALLRTFSPRRSRLITDGKECDLARRMGGGAFAVTHHLYSAVMGYASLHPSYATGRRRRRRPPVVGFDFDFDFPLPVGAAEHRSPFAMKRASCLRRPCISGAELGERANGREAQGTPHRGASLRVAFLLGTFSLAKQRKVPRPAKGERNAQVYQRNESRRKAVGLRCAYPNLRITNHKLY